MATGRLKETRQTVPVRRATALLFPTFLWCPRPIGSSLEPSRSSLTSASTLVALDGSRLLTTAGGFRLKPRTKAAS